MHDEVWIVPKSILNALSSPTNVQKKAQLSLGILYLYIFVFNLNIKLI